MAILTTHIRIKPKLINAFAEWQAQLYSDIAHCPGFVSLEILSPTGVSNPIWRIVQRFYDSHSLAAWRVSDERKKLMEELLKFLVDDRSIAFQEMESVASEETGNVTEVFVTKVNPDMESAYRKWIAKIHRMEAKLPGFRGIYAHAPSIGQKGNWLTLLQFDTQENLDQWLSSPEREEILKEAEPMIASFERHRVISPYAGWFAFLAKEGEYPSVWKQSMVVLLVLFPIVMLEIKYLSLLTGNLNPSLGTFIGNAISVTLIAWPMMPIAIWFLGWWLSPNEEKRNQTTVIGTFLILFLYMIEVAIFWNLL